MSSNNKDWKEYNANKPKAAGISLLKEFVEVKKTYKVIDLTNVPNQQTETCKEKKQSFLTHILLLIKKRNICSYKSQISSNVDI